MARKPPPAIDMGRISFDYLPASPLSNGWRLALPERLTFSFSKPLDRLDGVAIKAEDAIDYNVEKHQRVCNRVEFSAKLSEHSYVYARIGLVSADGLSVSRQGWITCDSGNKLPRRESRDEWVISRIPEPGGWTKFDLSLPDEVAQTFGKADAQQFDELLGFRLRGCLSISPIKLYRQELSQRDKAESTFDQLLKSARKALPRPRHCPRIAPVGLAVNRHIRELLVRFRTFGSCVLLNCHSLLDLGPQIGLAPISQGHNTGCRWAPVFLGTAEAMAEGARPRAHGEQPSHRNHICRRGCRRSSYE